MQPLKDRLALVTGASAGIGAATARALSDAGARVVLAARRKDRLEALAGEIGAAETLELDVRDAPRVQASLAPHAFDIVINNAGLGRGLGPIQEGSTDDWDEMIDTNIKGVLYVTRATLPGMIARGRGDMVLLGSVAGRQVYPGGNIYCATKHAVRATYEAMRVDTVGSGVRFTTVDPGMVETDFSRVRFHGDEKRAAEIYAGVDALQPTDVADAILYAVTRAPHINIGEIVMWASAQASTTQVTRR